MTSAARKNDKKIIVEPLTDQRKKELKIPPSPVAEGEWNVWECGPSAFPWHYDETEKCYLYEGDVKIITAGEVISIRKGDFVTFPAGLSCRWEVHAKVRKVYKFEQPD